MIKSSKTESTFLKYMYENHKRLRQIEFSKKNNKHLYKI